MHLHIKVAARLPVEVFLLPQPLTSLGDAALGFAIRASSRSSEFSSGSEQSRLVQESVDSRHHIRSERMEFCFFSGVHALGPTFDVRGRRSAEGAEGTCKRGLQAVPLDGIVGRHFTPAKEMIVGTKGLGKTAETSLGAPCIRLRVRKLVTSNFFFSIAATRTAPSSNN